MGASPSKDPAAARWQPDSAARLCSACKKAFSALRRRHHCRACGFVFCSDCSTSRVSNVRGYSEKKAVRACANCTRLLTPASSRAPSVAGQNDVSRSALLGEQHRRQPGAVGPATPRRNEAAATATTAAAGTRQRIDTGSKHATAATATAALDTSGGALSDTPSHSISLQPPPRHRLPLGASDSDLSSSTVAADHPAGLTPSAEVQQLMDTFAAVPAKKTRQEVLAEAFAQRRAALSSARVAATAIHPPSSVKVPPTLVALSCLTGWQEEPASSGVQSAVLRLIAAHNGRFVGSATVANASGSPHRRQAGVLETSDELIAATVARFDEAAAAAAQKLLAAPRDNQVGSASERPGGHFSPATPRLGRSHMSRMSSAAGSRVTSVTNSSVAALPVSPPRGGVVGEEWETDGSNSDGEQCRALALICRLLRDGDDDGYVVADTSASGGSSRSLPASPKRVAEITESLRFGTSPAQAALAMVRGNVVSRSPAYDAVLRGLRGEKLTVAMNTSAEAIGAALTGDAFVISKWYLARCKFPAAAPSMWSTTGNSGAHTVSEVLAPSVVGRVLRALVYADHPHALKSLLLHCNAVAAKCAPDPKRSEVVLARALRSASFWALLLRWAAASDSVGVASLCAVAIGAATTPSALDLDQAAAVVARTSTLCAEYDSPHVIAWLASTQIHSEVESLERAAARAHAVDHPILSAASAGSLRALVAFCYSDRQQKVSPDRMLASADLIDHGEGADGDGEVTGGFSPLHVAALMNQVDVLRWLLEATCGDDQEKQRELLCIVGLDSKDASGERTVLHFAASTGSTEFIAVFVEAALRAEVDIMEREAMARQPDGASMSPAMYAAQNNHAAAFGLLLQLDLGSATALDTAMGVSPLYVAAVSGNVEVLRQYSLRADVAAFDSEDTAAEQAQRLAVVFDPIIEGVNLIGAAAMQQQDGSVQWCLQELVRFTRDAADPIALRRDWVLRPLDLATPGATLLHLAAGHGAVTVLALFEGDAGADVGVQPLDFVAPDGAGDSIVQWAQRGGHAGVVKWLRTSACPKQAVLQALQKAPAASSS